MQPLGAAVGVALAPCQTAAQLTQGQTIGMAGKMGEKAEAEVQVCGCQSVLEAFFPMVKAGALGKKILVSVIDILDLDTRFACCIRGTLLPSLTRRTNALVEQQA